MNLRPHACEACALTELSYASTATAIIAPQPILGKHARSYLSIAPAPRVLDSPIDLAMQSPMGEISTMRSIAIIGAGFSGSILAVNLMRQGAPGFHIYLVERRGTFARGVAYSTELKAHLLNVPAGNMSALASDRDHFLRWLGRSFKDANYSSGSFVPRPIYARYLANLLENSPPRDASSNPRASHLEKIADDAVDITADNDRLRVVLSSGRQLDVDSAVLALGNFPPADPPIKDPGFYSTSYYRRDPWASDALSELASDAPVMLIGTGLTTVDLVLSLIESGHTGPIHAISRHGLIPRHHAPGKSAAQHAIDSTPASARALLRLARDRIVAGKSIGVNWQAEIDAFRPVTQSLWRRAAPSERARFLRHLRAFWDAHRHRIAPEVADRIESAHRLGQLIFHAGRIRGFEIRDGSVQASYERRGLGRIESVEVARVINCSGPSADFARMPDPLIRALLARGLVLPDPLGLGLQVAPDLRLVGNDPDRRLFALGPVTKGLFWEAVAVPELRQQCDALASELARAALT